MNIVMFTNCYLPQVGGVAQAVARTTQALRLQGHRVLVIAPDYECMPEREEDVVRMTAIQHFNGSDFSVILPVSLVIRERIDAFHPDLFHAHHPFLMGDIALRLAAERDIPLVFTHHTMYEHYTHYVPLDCPQMKAFVVQLSTGYANLCHRVVAPSESTARILRTRGVTTPIEVIPTGVNAEAFARGDGAPMRARLGLDDQHYVLGHVGRLAPEKNLYFLSLAVTDFLARHPRARFCIVGQGPEMARIRHIFKRRQLARQLLFAGLRVGQELIDFLHCANVFVFASQTETQGMVLLEALAAGCPAVALDAPGAREVIADYRNGRLVEKQSRHDFVAALQWVHDHPRPATLSTAARQSVRGFEEDQTISRLVKLYQSVLGAAPEGIAFDENAWMVLLRRLDREWDLWSNRIGALAGAVMG